MTGKLQGDVVATWYDTTHAWIALAVNEPEPDGRKEYNACVLLTDRVDSNGAALPDFMTLNEDDQLTELLNTVKAVRLQQVNPKQTLTFAKKVVTLD